MQERKRKAGSNIENTSPLIGTTPPMVGTIRDMFKRYV